MVPRAGLEPACGYPRWILSPLRLPFRHLGFVQLQENKAFFSSDKAKGLRSDRKNLNFTARPRRRALLAGLILDFWLRLNRGSVVRAGTGAGTSARPPNGRFRCANPQKLAFAITCRWQSCDPHPDLKTAMFFSLSRAVTCLGRFSFIVASDIK